MNLKEYVESRKKTDVKIKPLKVDPNILHGAIGIVTEAGELIDQIKRHICYETDLDIVNIEEELGDIFWYMFKVIDCIGSSPEKIFQKNIEKLACRYKNKKFNTDSAINRDLQKERDILEQ